MQHQPDVNDFETTLESFLASSTIAIFVYLVDSLVVVEDLA